MTNATSGARTARLTQLLGPLVTAAGFDLETVEVTPAGKRRLVRVVVDKDGGVNLDDVAAVSHDISAALDAADAPSDPPYVLEVTSPGVDRPLTLPRHWRRSVGRLVTVSRPAGGDLTGRVVSADDTSVVLDVGGAEQQWEFDDLGSGQVQVEFRHQEGEQ